MTTEEKKAFRRKKIWQDFRKEQLKIANNNCFICGIKKYKFMNLHHCDDIDYTNLDKKFYVLCKECHKLIERLKLRTKNKIDIDVLNKNLKQVYEDSI